MRRFFACLTVLLLCAAMFFPAAAADTDFTPSVNNKPAPEVVPIPDPDGEPKYGVIRDTDGEIIAYLDEDCLVVTAVADAKTSPYAEELLLGVYAQLTDGSMTIPYEKHNADLDSKNMVIRDLFDATVLCTEHPEMLEPEGVTLDITFKLGVEADEEVFVMTYKDSEWNPIVKTVNNGDGTVTCTFEKLCPVEFSVVTEKTPSPTGDFLASQLPLWTLVAAISLLAILVLAVIYRRDLMKNGSR